MTLSMTDERAHDHLVRMRVDEELREARAMARWWDENPSRQQVWPDLYAEHKAVLALIERLAAE